LRLIVYFFVRPHNHDQKSDHPLATTGISTAVKVSILIISSHKIFIFFGGGPGGEEKNKTPKPNYLTTSKCFNLVCFFQFSFLFKKKPSKHFGPNLKHFNMRKNLSCYNARLIAVTYNTYDVFSYLQNLFTGFQIWVLKSGVQ